MVTAALVAYSVVFRGPDAAQPTMRFTVEDSEPSAPASVPEGPPSETKTAIPSETDAVAPPEVMTSETDIVVAPASEVASSEIDATPPSSEPASGDADIAAPSPEAIPAQADGAVPAPAGVPSDTEVAGLDPTTQSPSFADQALSGDIPAPIEQPAMDTPAPVDDEAVLSAIRAKLDDEEPVGEAVPGEIPALKSFYAEHSGPPLWMENARFTAKGRAVIEEIAKADEWGLSSAAFDLPDADGSYPTAEDQAAAELKLDLAILQYARHARGGRTDPAALSKLIDQKPDLPDPRTVLNDVSSAGAPEVYLTSLHPKHEQFERLRQALLKARAEPESPDSEKTIRQLIVNMERWRWMPEDLGASYVWVNLPEFMVHAVKDGKFVRSEKIIVGSPKQPTPVFTADLQSVVFNPERVLPQSIVRGDLLPKLREARGWFGKTSTAVLDKYQIKITSKGKPVDASTIDWKKADIDSMTFIQAPGPTNILGKVQFLYPNAHGVYMYEGLNQAPFARSVRVGGDEHPRVANAAKFAAVLLAEDKNWPVSKIDKLMADGTNAVVSLGSAIPVHTTYFTMSVDEEGALKTFTDIYSLDDVTASAVIDNEGPQPAVAGSVPVPPRKPGAGSVAESAP